jgi:hypothetical protein
MTKSENVAMKDIKGPWKLIAYLFRYRAKELLALLAIILLGIILTMNISYSKQDGLQWRPAAKVEIKKGDITP